MSADTIDIHPKVGKLTKSEQAILDGKISDPDTKVLYVCRARGGWLLIHFEKVNVRKTAKHEPPFKYIREAYGKKGARVQRWAGNIWDEEEKDILDDWTINKSSHLNGYKN